MDSALTRPGLQQPLIYGTVISGLMLAEYFGGLTLAAATVSCCAHYLVNVAPVLGQPGSWLSRRSFKLKLFCVGSLFNAAGIAYVAGEVLKASKEHEQCLA